MIERFSLKPGGTIWIGYDIFASYDCATKPKISEKVITNLRQFGFIISHEYEIVADVGKVRRNKCTKEDCKDAISYTFV